MPEKFFTQVFIHSIIHWGVFIENLLSVRYQSRKFIYITLLGLPTTLILFMQNRDLESWLPALNHITNNMCHAPYCPITFGKIARTHAKKKPVWNIMSPCGKLLPHHSMDEKKVWLRENEWVSLNRCFKDLVEMRAFLLTSFWLVITFMFFNIYCLIYSSSGCQKIIQGNAETDYDKYFQLYTAPKND